MWRQDKYFAALNAAEMKGGWDKIIAKLKENAGELEKLH